MPDTPQRFDTKGFLFSLSAVLLLVIIFTATHLSSVALGDLAVASEVASANSVVARAQEWLDQLKKMRTTPSGQLATVVGTRNIPAFDLAAHVPASGKAIAADLAGMKVDLYQDGVAIAEYPILSKGKDGSRWQTPVGAYAVQTKETTHLSSIGEVYMPYSMQFYGNFFIHGWPTYPGGQPVPIGYTGGCIRLSTDDAAKVFAFASVGTPIFVYENSDSKLAQSAPTITANSQPDVAAKAFLVADVNTGLVYAEKNATEVRPIASVSKLLTAIVANEAITYDRKIAVTQHVMDTFGEKNLKLGDRLTSTDLLNFLLMQSDNGAAVALADSYGSGNFIRLMNSKASALGMNDTHFEDPHGISANNVSTADDLFRLARYMYHNETYLLGITRTPAKSVLSADGNRYSLANFNVFSGLPTFVGGKTGKTNAAQETMVALFSYADPTDPTSTSTLAVIVLGTDDRKRDVSSLYQWALSSLNTSPAVAEDRNKKIM